LQYVAVCCIVLHRVAACRSALQRVAVCCSVLQCVAVCCNGVIPPARPCSCKCTYTYTAWCCASQCVTVCCSVSLCVAVRCHIWHTLSCSVLQDVRRACVPIHEYTYILCFIVCCTVVHGAIVCVQGKIHRMPKLQVIFRQRATNYRSLLRKMIYKDKASYRSWPPCKLLVFL